jgi:hypothetical protein
MPRQHAARLLKDTEQRLCCCNNVKSVSRSSSIIRYPEVLQVRLWKDCSRFPTAAVDSCVEDSSPQTWAYRHDLDETRASHSGFVHRWRMVWFGSCQFRSCFASIWIDWPPAETEPENPHHTPLGKRGSSHISSMVHRSPSSLGQGLVLCRRISSDLEAKPRQSNCLPPVALSRTICSSWVARLKKPIVRWASIIVSTTQAVFMLCRMCQKTTSL